MLGIPFPRRLARSAKRRRLLIARALGWQRYTWASLNGLDRQLVAHFGGQRDGRFLEIGANDGLQQNNTLALELLYGWTGVLVEANPQLASECHRNRPRARVVCAGASAGVGLMYLTGADLMGKKSTTPTGISVPTLPLAMILQVEDLPDRLDLLSLDVEGHELEVLAGLDIEQHGPHVLLVETQQLERVTAALAPRYRHHAQWSPHDHVFLRA